MTNPEWIFERLFDVRTILDILVVAILLYWLLWVVQGTRASSLIRGIVGPLCRLLEQVAVLHDFGR